MNLFLSYSRKDKDFAEKLIEIFQGAGHEIWYDKGGIFLGQQWPGEISKAIKRSEGFVILLSKNSVTSADVVKELGIAANNNKPILPVELHQVSIPPTFEYYLSNWQRLNINDILSSKVDTRGIIFGLDSPSPPSASSPGIYKTDIYSRRRAIIKNLLIGCLIGFLLGTLGMRAQEPEINRFKDVFRLAKLYEVTYPIIGAGLFGVVGILLKNYRFFIGWVLAITGITCLIWFGILIVPLGSGRTTPMEIISSLFLYKIPIGLLLGMATGVLVVAVNQWTGRLTPLAKAKQASKIRYRLMNVIAIMPIALLITSVIMVQLLSFSTGSTPVDKAIRKQLGSIKIVKESDLNSIEFLILNDIRISGNTIPAIKALPYLNTLTIYNTHLNENDLSQIGTFIQLEGLDLKRTYITDYGLEHLNTLRNLKSLNLGNNPTLKGFGIKSLTNLKGLASLSLSGNKLFVNAHMKYLEAFDSLAFLSLSGTGITNDGLKSISKLRMLEWLDLSNTNISGEGLMYLSPILNLETLSLEGTNVSDRGIQHLLRLTNLKHLSIKATKITAAGERALKNRLQETIVSYQ